MKTKALLQRGATMVEYIIAMPMFILLIFVIAEFSLMYQAKSVLDVATLAAARAGATHGGNIKRMKGAAIIALTPLYTTEATVSTLGRTLSSEGISGLLNLDRSDLNNRGILEGAAASVIDNVLLPHLVGSTSLTSPDAAGSIFNDYDFDDLENSQLGGVKVEILSPTPEMVKGFGVNRNYGNANSPKTKVIPNDNLMYRDSKVIRSGVNIQDANLLKIRVTYLYKPKMPLVKYFFTPLMNANLTNVLFQGGSTFSGGPAAGEIVNAMELLGGWHVPLVSYATVRMQSDFGRKN